VRQTIGPIALIIELGATVVVATMLPLVIGIWLDREMHTAPWITLVGLGAGILAAVTAVYRIISASYRKLS
jgi:F0F1-type ATP synthase assembly protein I